MTELTTFMMLHPWATFWTALILGGFIGLLIAGLCNAASDADCRLEQHLMELDEFEEEMK